MTVITALPSGGAEIVNANTAPVLVSAMKQAIVARTDIGMGQGKLAAQVAHASLSAYEKADSQLQDQWKQGGQKKVVLKGQSERQLHELSEIAKSEGFRPPSSGTPDIPNSSRGPSPRWPSARRRTIVSIA